jgi:hypothetical protein
MAPDVLGDLAIGAQRGGEDEPDLLLLEHVAGAVPRPRLRSAVGDELVAEGSLVVVRCLLRVADPELDEIRPVDRKGVVGRRGRG